MTNDCYNILLCPSKSIFKQALVVMLSAMQNCKKSCHFYIMQSDWDEMLKKECKDFLSAFPNNCLDIIDVDNSTFKTFTPFRGKFTCYYKILAHMYLPTDIERILYLDPDAMVLKDIEKYYSMDFGDKYLIASSEVIERKKFDMYYNDPLPHGYINTGVLLINLASMRRDNIDIDFYKSSLKNVTSPYFADQGLLAHSFKGKIKLLLGYRYNRVMFQCGSIEKPFSYDNIFSMTKEERCEKICQELKDEDFIESESETIVHFAGLVSKPWDTILTKTKHGEDDVVIPRLEDMLKPPDVIKYYLKWWDLASQLPEKYYEQILFESHNSAVFRPNGERTAFNKAAVFFESVSYDCLDDNKIIRFLHFISSKKVSVIKVGDMAGRFLTYAIQKIGGNIVFTSPKSTLSQLNDDEWLKCKSADIVICCCIHGTPPVERDGIKPIMFCDILHDDSLTAGLPLLQTTTDTALFDMVTAELKAVREELSSQNTHIAEKLIEYHSGLESAKMLEQRIMSLGADKDRLNIELGRMSSENQFLRERINECDKISSELKIGRNKAAEDLEEVKKKYEVEMHSVRAEKDCVVVERDKLKVTVNDLEENVKKLTESNKTISEQNEQLTSGLSEVSLKLSSAEEKAKTLKQERDALQSELDSANESASRSKKETDEAKMEIERLNKKIADFADEVKQIKNEYDGVLTKLKAEQDENALKDNKITELSERILAMENSRSWRYTKIFRRNTDN